MSQIILAIDAEGEVVIIDADDLDEAALIKEYELDSVEAVIDLLGEDVGSWPTNRELRQ